MDIIILGNGCAGHFAALYAARLGLSTMILGENPTSILSGVEPSESVHPGLQSLLKKFGGEKSVDYASRGTYDGIWVNSTFNPLCNIPGEVWEGHHLSKSAFKYHLAFQTRQAQVSVIKNDLVRNINDAGQSVELTLSSGKKCQSRYLIDATGRSRLAGRWLGFTERNYSKPLFATTGRVLMFEPAKSGIKGTSFCPETNGFTWLAPEPTNECTWTRVNTKKTLSLDVPDQFANICQPLSKTYSFNVRWRCYDQVAKKKVFLIGDSACMLDPGLGQGIFNACRTAIGAVNAISSILNNGKNKEIEHNAYNDWFKDFYHYNLESLKNRYLDLGIELFD